jgi:hypothetical protein
MLLLCQLQMTLPLGFPGGVWGDSSADEQSGAAAVRRAAGFESAAVPPAAKAVFDRFEHDLPGCPRHQPGICRRIGTA